MTRRDSNHAHLTADNSSSSEGQNYHDVQDEGFVTTWFDPYLVNLSSSRQFQGRPSFRQRHLTQRKGLAVYQPRLSVSHQGSIQNLRRSSAMGRRAFLSLHLTAGLFKAHFSYCDRMLVFASRLIGDSIQTDTLLPSFSWHRLATCLFDAMVVFRFANQLIYREVKVSFLALPYCAIIVAFSVSPKG